MAATLKLVSFTAHSTLSPATNLSHFIAYCRDELTLWADRADFNWEASFWPDSRPAGRLRFTNLDNSRLHPRVIPRQDQLLHPALVEVFKAYLRYRHTLKPHRNAARELQAFRALEKALVEDMQVPDITRLQVRHFHRAAQLVAGYAGRQNIVLALLQMLGLLSQKLIVPAEVVRWQNPYVGEKSYDTLRGGNAPAPVKQEKAADQDALLSIAEVFSLPLSQLDDSDIMVTSITALLMCAPMRIGETLRWRTDCLRTDSDQHGTAQHYLAYYVPKTRSYARKPVPATMGDVARQAVDRLVSITEEGRCLARYLETDPTRFYRHAGCPDVADDQPLTPEQVSQALGFRHKKACEDFIRKHTGRYCCTGFTLDMLWQMVLIEHHAQNPHFPYQQAPGGEVQPLRMSESLLCFRRLQLGARASTSPVLLAPFNPDYYRKRLDGTVHPGKNNERPLCFFAKHGLDLRTLNSHGLRHFINRLAQRGDLSIEAITQWSSRASVQQSRTYLHQTSQQRRERAATLLQTRQEHPALAPVTSDEASGYGAGPYHRSRYGLCRRSWRAGPCTKFADCTNCSELLACKGDKIALTAVQEDLQHMLRTREAAYQAMREGERSGGLWLAKAEPQIDRLIALVNLLQDPAIADGSPLQVTGADFSHESQLVHEQARHAGVELLDPEQLAREYGQELVDCLKMLAQ